MSESFIRRVPLFAALPNAPRRITLCGDVDHHREQPLGRHIRRETGKMLDAVLQYSDALIA